MCHDSKYAGLSADNYNSEVDTKMYYGAEGVLQRGVAAWTNKNETQQTMTQWLIQTYILNRLQCYYNVRLGMVQIKVDLDSSETLAARTAEVVLTWVAAVKVLNEWVPELVGKLDLDWFIA